MSPDRSTSIHSAKAIWLTAFMNIVMQPRNVAKFVHNFVIALADPIDEFQIHTEPTTHWVSDQRTKSIFKAPALPFIAHKTRRACQGLAHAQKWLGPVRSPCFEQKEIVLTAHKPTINGVGART